MMDITLVMVNVNNVISNVLYVLHLLLVKVVIKDISYIKTYVYHNAHKNIMEI